MATKWAHCLLARINSNAASVTALTVVGTYVQVPQSAVTFTPKITCRALVLGTFDVEITTGATIFGGALRVATGGGGAVNQAPLAVLQAAAGHRQTLVQHWTVDLVAGTSYTFDLAGAILTAGGASLYSFAHAGLTIELVPKPEDGP